VQATVICWGSNSSKQCNVPAGLNDVVTVSCGGHHTVVLTAAGKVLCWGNNTFRQCKPPTNLEGVVDISGGTDHTAALTEDGRLICWGRNKEGPM
jgi:alpha-tubulin suppressor-like RCC1 family protein